MPEVKIGTYMLRGLESVLVYNSTVGQVLNLFILWFIHL